MIETKSKKNAWIAFIAVLAFLALIFGLDQWIKPTDKLGMLLIVLQKGSVYAFIGKKIVKCRRIKKSHGIIGMFPAKPHKIVIRFDLAYR